VTTAAFIPRTQEATTLIWTIHVVRAMVIIAFTETTAIATHFATIILNHKLMKADILPKYIP